MQELQLTGLATKATSVVVPGSGVRYLGVTFSPDGNYLYFTRKEKSDAGVLYKLALPGGAPIRIKDDVDSPIAFSPDGNRFSFVRFNRAGSEYSLMTADRDGNGERTIAVRRNGNTFSLFRPAWSPDGETIVCAAGWWDNGYHMNLVELGVEDGHEEPISEQRWFSVFEVAWLDDKSGLIISAREQSLSPNQLWRISYPQGESVRMTNDMAEYRTVSVSGDKIVAVRGERVWKIWVVTNGDVQRATAIASGVGFSYGLDWTGKGKIVFSSMAQDKLDISLINPDGSNKTQLTANAGDNYTPAASPDGRLIVFSSNRSGSFNIWRMNADDGSDPRQLTFSDGNSYPSSDNQWVFYDNQSGARVTVWKVPIEGGEPVQVTDEYARMPAVSPDTRFMACRYYVQAGLVGIAILPLQGESPIRRVPEIPIIDWQQVQWTADGRALTYIDIANGISNIWSYDLGTLTSSQVTYFQSEQIFAYAWSPNYRQLACQRGTQVSDVTIISGQRLSAQQVPRR
jgi:Tol biopolymer transport system component